MRVVRRLATPPSPNRERPSRPGEARIGPCPLCPCVRCPSEGNTRNILHKFSVDLPKKHGRGGQSAARFARLRMEKRKNYIRKVAEIATQMFIENDRPSVTGLVLAGSAAFKVELQQSAVFDQRLKKVVIKTVDVSYGGENGFNQARNSRRSLAL